MSDKLHLLIPGAVLPVETRLPPSAPNLRALLASMAPAGRVERTGASLSLPCEIALARLLGLPDDDGHIPWAAVESGTTGVPCAWIKLCHWRVGADHVALVPADDLAVDDATSAALLAAMAPYFLEDGITLRAMPEMPGVWLATGAIFQGLPTLSMDLAAGQRLTPASLNTGGGAPLLRRLQNEMQMLLYTHPANEERQRRGMLAINSFWVMGAGMLMQPFVPVAHVRVESRLVAPARQRDAEAHARVWQAVDADTCAQLLALLRAGADARLTLCGEQAAQEFVPARTGYRDKFKRAFGLTPAWDGWTRL